MLANFLFLIIESYSDPFSVQLIRLLIALVYIVLVFFIVKVLKYKKIIIIILILPILLYFILYLNAKYFSFYKTSYCEVVVGKAVNKEEMEYEKIHGKNSTNVFGYIGSGFVLDEACNSKKHFSLNYLMYQILEKNRNGL